MKLNGLSQVKFSFQPMNDRYAEEIVSDWHYAGIYSFYDMDADKEDLALFMNKQYWTDVTCGVVNETGELVGWASFYVENDEFWLSLGLRPDLTGHGMGKNFVNACIEYAASNYDIPNNLIKLTVAEFNEKAIKVYRRVGFHECGREIRDTHIGQLPFIVMEQSTIQ